MKRIMPRFFAFIMTLVLALSALSATAETAGLGSLPQRGVDLPLTQADMESGLGVETDIISLNDSLKLPLINLYYVAPAAVEAVAKAEQAAAQNDETAFYQALNDYVSHIYALSTVFMVETALYTEDLVEGSTLLGENDGYTYGVLSQIPSAEDAEEQALAQAAYDRAQELLAGMTFRPIEFTQEELAELSGLFPAFTTQDLNGNTVTNEIFAGKDLTVINIWGTFCSPCVEEMPELAQWHAAMPENVQIIGLVSDLSTAADTETLELAQYICQATGVTFTNLIANEDFAPYLNTVTAVPTTLFVDGQGKIVGSPIVGANVAGYKAYVEEYLNGLQ